MTENTGIKEKARQIEVQEEHWNGCNKRASGGQRGGEKLDTDASWFASKRSRLVATPIPDSRDLRF